MVGALSAGWGSGFTRAGEVAGCPRAEARGMTTTPRPHPSRHLVRALLGLGLLSSLITAALGLRWLLSPGDALLAASGTPPPLLEILGSGPMYTAQLVVAVLGAVAGVAGLAITGSRASVSRLVAVVLAAVAAAQVALFGLGFASFMTLAQAGYLIALAMPVLLVTVAALLVRHGGRARWAVGVPLLTAMVLGALLGAGIIRDVALAIIPAMVRSGGLILVTVHFVLAGALWAAVALLLLRRAGAFEGVEAWTVRWRRPLTIIAACGPLPYALSRLTWLTPWPIVGGEAAAADPATRVWGLALSTGAWLGVVLTLGLIRPWGEVFPRWFPVVGGRSVPIVTAAIPGFAIAALLCFAAVPILLSASEMGLASTLEFALVFPCWLWGPTLALAVWGYVGHRRSTIGSRADRMVSTKMDA